MSSCHRRWTRRERGGAGSAISTVHTYMSCAAHAWLLFGSVQALPPICPDIVLSPKQRHTAVPSQDRDPITQRQHTDTHTPSPSRPSPLEDKPDNTFRDQHQRRGVKRDSQPWQRRFKNNEKQSREGQWKEKHPSLNNAHPRLLLCSAKQFVRVD